MVREAHVAKHARGITREGPAVAVRHVPLVIACVMSGGADRVRDTIGPVNACLCGGGGGRVRTTFEHELATAGEGKVTAVTRASQR